MILFQCVCVVKLQSQLEISLAPPCGGFIWLPQWFYLYTADTPPAHLRSEAKITIRHFVTLWDAFTLRENECESDRLSITFNILLILSGRKDQRRKIFAFVCVSTSAKCNSTLQIYTASQTVLLNAKSHGCQVPFSSGQTSTMDTFTLSQKQMRRRKISLIIVAVNVKIAL